MNSSTWAHYLHTSTSVNAVRCWATCFSIWKPHSPHLMFSVILIAIYISFLTIGAIARLLAFSTWFYAAMCGIQRLCSFHGPLSPLKRWFLIIFFMLGIGLQVRRHWSFGGSWSRASFLGCGFISYVWIFIVRVRGSFGVGCWFPFHALSWWF